MRRKRLRTGMQTHQTVGRDSGEQSMGHDGTKQDMKVRKNPRFGDYMRCHSGPSQKRHVPS